MKETARVRQGRIFISNTQRRLRLPAGKIRELVWFIARSERRAIERIDIAVVGRRRMASLNARHLHRRGVTDVLSFDLGIGPAGGLCVQVVVCADVALRQARRRGRAAWKELLLYVAHGLLHAMDYDDGAPRQARRMHEMEDRLLEEFGIGRVFNCQLTTGN